MLHFVASEPDLQCLHITPKWVSGLKRVNTTADQQCRPISDFLLSQNGKYIQEKEDSFVMRSIQPIPEIVEDVCS